MKKALRVAVLSDTHFQAKTDGKDSFCWNVVRCSQSLASLSALVDQLKTLDLDLILHLGDFTNACSIKNFDDEMMGLKQLGVPVHEVRGNHDTGPVQRRLADPQGRIDQTFVVNDVRFVLLDSCVRETELDPLARDKRRRIIQPDQLAWLEKILIDDPDSFTIIASHLPLKTSLFYPTTVDPDRQSVNGLSADAINKRIGYIGNSDEVWSLIRRFANVRLCLAGHWHINEINLVDQIPCIITASTCEFPCQFRLLTIDPEHITIETLPSGIDPLSSYVAANKNDFPLGEPEDRERVIPFAELHDR